jgi:hypothetical protein
MRSAAIILGLAALCACQHGADPPTFAVAVLRLSGARIGMCPPTSKTTPGWL